MIQSQMITSVLVWERKLATEEERRKNHPYVNYLAPLKYPQKERTNRKENQSPANFVKALIEL